LTNQTVTFLGENPGDIPQVYRFGVFTKRLARLTHHPTAVVSYDITRDGREIVYEAAPQPKNLLETEQVRRRGWGRDVALCKRPFTGSGEVTDDPRGDRELFVHALARERSSNTITRFSYGVFAPRIISRRSLCRTRGLPEQHSGTVERV